jgi:acyl-CoA thioesterase
MVCAPKEVRVTGTTQDTAERAARALFAGDRASQHLGMVLSAVQPGVARVTMEVRPEMTNGHGICHGGIIFALADSAFAFACNSHGPATVAAGVAIDFLVPAKVGDQLTAVATERWLRGRTGLYELSVTRADGTLIALAHGRSHRLRSTHGPTPT